MPTPIAQPPALSLLAFAARGAFAMGLLAVTVLSLAPAQSLPDLGVSDKILHALAYSLLAASGCFGFGLTSLREQIVVVVALSAFGGLIEVVQPLLADRDRSLIDAMANQTGIAIGWMLARAAGARLQKWARTSGSGVGCGTPEAPVASPSPTRPPSRL